MSLLTKKSIYGLMAIYELYKQKDNPSPLHLKDIAKATDISQSYLEQIFIDLKKANLVYSIRGARGGYNIVKSEQEISIKDIIIALDGEINTIKEETKDPVFNLFFYECDKELNDIFDKPLSHIGDYEQLVSNQVNYSI